MIDPSTELGTGDFDDALRGPEPEPDPRWAIPALVLGAIGAFLLSWWVKR